MTALDPIAEKTLLNAVANGNEQAFALLFRHYHPFLAEHLLRVVNSEQVMQELLQDVFLKIWVNREKLTKVENFTAYLYIVSRNHALNALEKLANEFNAKSAYLKDPGLFEDQPGDEHRALQTALLDEAIDSLPARQKEVYLLHRHERLSYNEIAEKLGIGRETVKTHLEKAVKSIKEYLGGRLPVLILLLQIFRN